MRGGAVDGWTQTQCSRPRPSSVNAQERGGAGSGVHVVGDFGGTGIGRGDRKAADEQVPWARLAQRAAIFRAWRTVSVTRSGTAQHAQAMVPIAAPREIPDPVIATCPARNVTKANVTT